MTFLHQKEIGLISQPSFRFREQRVAWGRNPTKSVSSKVLLVLPRSERNEKFGGVCKARQLSEIGRWQQRRVAFCFHDS
jgi:hypothetical protein